MGFMAVTISYRQNILTEILQFLAVIGEQQLLAIQQEETAKVSQGLKQLEVTVNSTVLPIQITIYIFNCLKQKI
jgi:hypothetical protein